ncbi:MAG: protein translocase subunit SecD [Gemmatimonadales bacterium]|nr:protein translocase subunit SecD [Gemmatimonadales bacterium]
MSSSIRNRLILIAILVLGSIIALIPRNRVERISVNGVLSDVTVRRVPLKLGLDLQGGMHLELGLDESQKVSTDPERDIELALTILRKRMDEFGVTEPLVQLSGSDRIVVELAGITEPGRAKDIVTKNAFLEFRLTDKTNALDAALPAMDRALGQLGVTLGADVAPSGVAAILGGKSNDSAAVDSTGAAVAPVGRLLQDMIQPSAGPGGSTPGEYMVSEAAYLRVDSLINLPAVQRAWPRGYDLRWSRVAEAVGAEQVRYLYVLEEEPMITGQNLTSAAAQIDPLNNQPMVVFELDRAGARRFGTETSRHTGDFMAIVLDGRVQGRPPVINSRIDRRGQITLGNQSIQQAQDLALTLEAGALPVPLKVLKQGTVGPTLGADSIRNGITAGLVGTLLVVLIMIGYYRFAGVLAVIGLGMYLLFTLGVLATLEATLTLPGLAGLVLSIGIAVDANVLIFERIREELALGKTPRLAADEGFHRAMNAIIDSNVSTIITALLLFQFGTGPVRGFAVTLIVGTLASMVSAIFVVRTFFLLWLSRRTTTAELSI